MLSAALFLGLGAGMATYLGQLAISQALGDGSLSLAGRRELCGAFSGWLGLSPFATPQA